MPQPWLTAAIPIQSSFEKDTSVTNAAGPSIQFKGSSKKPANSAGEHDRKVLDTRFTRKPTAVHTFSSKTVVCSKKV